MLGKREKGVLELYCRDKGESKNCLVCQGARISEVYF